MATTPTDQNRGQTMAATPAEENAGQSMGTTPAEDNAGQTMATTKAPQNAAGNIFSTTIGTVEHPQYCTYITITFLLKASYISGNALSRSQQILETSEAVQSRLVPHSPS